MSDHVFDDNILAWRAQGRVGAVLRNKWRLDRLLGVGGMAAVYEGTHRNGKRGAVKVLHLELSMHEDARARFLQEGYVANRVDHPGAVSVLDDDVAKDGSVFLVMELLEGRTLEEISAAQPWRRLGAPEALAIADQLLDVLAAAHDKGIVHRDLKPENLFLTREGRVKVLDFGLARVREAQGARMTKTGSAMGTPAFLPPEQAHGQWDKVDGRTDLWAVGATLFTLLTGRLVHEADNLNKLLLAAMTHPAPAIRSALPDLPKPAAALVDKALAFEPKDRWSDARAMQKALREAAKALPAPADLTSLLDASRVDGPFEQNPTLLSSAISRDRASSPPQRARAWLAAAGAGAALLAGAIGFLATRGAPQPDAPLAAAAQPAAESPVPPASPAPPPTPAAPAPAQPEVAPQPEQAPPADTTATSAQPAPPEVRPAGATRPASGQGASRPPAPTGKAKDPFTTKFE